MQQGCHEAVVGGLLLQKMSKVCETVWMLLTGGTSSAKGGASHDGVQNGFQDLDRSLERDLSRGVLRLPVRL